MPQEETIGLFLPTFYSLWEKHDLTAKANFTCCQSCGCGEIEDYMEEGDIGYVFFHIQDTEGAIESQDIHVSFGCYENENTKEDKNKEEEIGQKIVQTFRDAGFQVEWNGSSGQRPCISLTEKDVEDLRTLSEIGLRRL